MRRRWNARLVGFAVLFALLVGGAWYSSQDDTLACVVPVGHGDGSKLNKYRICLVNGVAGIGWFFMAMPDSYATCWKQALDWVWAMRYQFDVGGSTYHKWPAQQGDDTSKVMVRQQADIGISFIDAYVESDSAYYRDCAYEVAKYLMIDSASTGGTYKVMHHSTDDDFGEGVYWRASDEHGTPSGDTNYSYKAGSAEIGLYFLKMYANAATSADSATFYSVARRCAQFLKAEAIIDSAGTGPTDPVRAKWKYKARDEAYECPATICEGTPGVIRFLDSMYVAASDSGDSDSLTDLRFARAGIRWLKNTAQNAIVDDDTLYWWKQYPDYAQDNTYSPVWGRGAAGVGETFLLGYKDLASNDQSLRNEYWHYAKGAAK
jgi:hypothetical protein